MDSASTLHHSTGDGRARARWHLLVAHHERRGLLGRGVSLAAAETVELGRGYAGLGEGTLGDAKVSRRHARVRARDDGVAELEDAGSENGTYVNGARLEGPALLAHGDVIRIGSILLLALHGDDPPRPTGHPELPGMSPHAAQLVARLPALAASARPLVLRGEAGTGKAYLAGVIHRAGGRPGPLVRARAAALPDAAAEREALLAGAARGTLVLEEIAGASPAAQAALARLLSRPAEVRVIATTASDPDGLAVRAELRAALRGDTITLPPLRHRPEDVPLLADGFLRRLTGEGGSFHWRTALELLRHAWPGNVRELEQRIGRLVADAGGAAVVRLGPAEAPAIQPASAAPQGVALPPRRLSRRRLEELLREHDGNVTTIAALLGVGRNTLYRWLKAAGLDLEGYRR